MSRTPHAARAGRLALLGVLSMLAACGAPTSGQLTVTIQPSQQINPNSENQPSPVVLRVYDLKGTDYFTSAPFAELYPTESAKFGPDMLGRREVFVEPGKPLTLTEAMPPQTTAIGILVAFRSLDNAVWRMTLPVEWDSDTSVTLLLSAHAVSQAPPSSGFLGLF